MTQDHDQSMRAWQAALQATLVDAIEHLQVLIFTEGWDALRASTGSDEDALRESVARYERELARLFGFVRALGALPDAVAWSTLKTVYRRAALDAGAEISLRTALETGLYAAESVPPGDHDGYLCWAAALQRFLASRVSVGANSPGPDASDDERLFWAYETLAALEDHDAFSVAFIDWLTDAIPEHVGRQAIVDLHERLLTLPRFDVVLNTSLRWLAASHA